jgi:hypothetical protein
MPPLRLVEKLCSAATEKLSTSGISADQAQALGMYSVEDASKLHPSFEAQPALVLPYFNAQKQPMKARTDWPEFYRVRYLGKEVKSFKDVTKAPSRYTQPPNTGVCAYLAPCVDWKALQDDPNEPLLITEGELKAAKACLEGFPTIGLGGVYNFRSAKHGVFFLPELEAFKWARRRVTIVYDSDYLEKPNICAAINVLAEELQERGALVELATLPNVYTEEGKKTGLDDFLVARDDDALIKVLHQAEQLTLVRRLWQMNEEVCYIKDPGLIIDVRTRIKLTPYAFTGHSEWSTLNVPERKVTKDGSVSYVKTDAASAWLNWPLRNSARKATYLPGQPKYVDECFNQWEGWGCEPKKGDVSPWKQLIDFIYAGAEKEHVEWFLDWCAYPLQFPGTKLFSACVVHGRLTGTGKSLIGYTLGKIYGKNFTRIENKHLKRDFNGWAENRQFILGDEISGTDKRAEADAFKTTITQEEISINVKMLPEYTVPDCINYYFTSNHADAFFLEDEDRRFFVHEVTQFEPLPSAFYKKYDEWKEGNGPSALFHWLLQRDLRNFNPKDRAPRTRARDRMLMQGKSDIAVWCAELRQFPDGKLHVGQLRHVRDMFTAHELLQMYIAENDVPSGKVTANGMSRALAAAGFQQAYGGSPLPAQGRQGRYFIIRNEDKWLKARVARDFIRNIELPPARAK